MRGRIVQRGGRRSAGAACLAGALLVVSPAIRADVPFVDAAPFTGLDLVGRYGEGVSTVTDRFEALLQLRAQAVGAPDWDGQRERMLRTQIERRGLRDPRVLRAMRAVPRHRFVPENERARAYQDRALPIGSGQPISQPYVVASMTLALDPQPGDRVLEVGTGSGYQAAVLSPLVGTVFTIEILPELAERARDTLQRLGYENVIVVTGDGYRGLPEEAPFDGIIVTAAPERVPQALLDQLAAEARLVIPVGRRRQSLKVFHRTGGGIRSETLFGVRFVPMTGDPGREEPHPKDGHDEHDER